MNRIRSFWLLALLMFGAITVHARAPIMDIEDAPIPATLTMEQIERAIVTGVRRGWATRRIAPGHIEAKLAVRSHVAVVDIFYDESAFSIRYKDSHNLDYKAGKIHRNYNRWIRNLELDLSQSFQAQLVESRPNRAKM